MSLLGFKPKELYAPRGAWTALDQIATRNDRAFLARNVRFPPSRAKTREGTSAVFAVDGKVTNMHHYLSATADWLFFFEDGVIKVRVLDTGVTVTLFTLAGRVMTIAEAGRKAYIAIALDNGNSAGQARFVNEDVVGNPIDKAFMAPYIFTPTIMDTGAGLCTAGAHNFGYLVTSRSGFPGKPSPAPSNIFTPTSFTTAAGGRELRFEVTVDVTNPPVTIRPIMSTAENPNEYFIVPDAEATIFVAGTGLPIAITISIADDVLAAGATAVEPNFQYLSQSVDGSGPFNPSRLINYGNRMVYVVGTKVYISEPLSYEIVTDDQHTQEIPGRKIIVTGFQIRNTLYLLGPSYTAGLNDNGAVPRSWAIPYLVSASLGATGLDCVEWRTRGDYAWVANQRGCWVFDGQYSEKPVTFYIAEWQQIDWTKPNLIRMCDDTINQRLHVAAPVITDEAPTPTECNRVFVFDYSRGIKPEQIDYSLDDFDADSFSSLCFLFNKTLGKSEIWKGPSASGNIMKFDETADNDGDTGVIDSIWESGFIVGPRESKSRINRFGRAELSVIGAGDLGLTAYGKDRISSFALPSLALTAQPGKDLMSNMDLRNENMSLRLRSNALGARFDVSMIRVYWREYMMNR